jgi:probable F420-dependent oxidoreductase
MARDGIRFGVQAALGASGEEWLTLAARVEDLGFDALYVGDHLGVAASPFAALAAAASVTTTLRLGTYVLNCGILAPLAIASEAATLDRLSDGRCVLGLGAGHTPSEWTMSGRAHPSPAARVARLVETVDVVAALLRGDVVTHHGAHLDLDDAQLSAPRPVQDRIPMLIGGNGRTLLGLAGRAADIVGLSGLVRTLADGHRHEVDWRPDAIDERVAIVRAAAAASGRENAIVFDALVQHVAVTEHRDDAADQCARRIAGSTPSDVVAAPFVLVGTIDQLVEEVIAHRDRWGITSYVVRADAIDHIAPLVARLAGA